MIHLLREIRELTGLGLAQLHDLIKETPATIGAGLPNVEANAMKARLEAVGARIEIKRG